MDQVGKGAMVNEEEIGANKGGILTKGSPPFLQLHGCRKEMKQVGGKSPECIHHIASLGGDWCS